MTVSYILRKLLASPISHLQAFDRKFAAALRESLLHPQGPGSGAPEPDWFSTLTNVSDIKPEWFLSEPKHFSESDNREFFGLGRRIADNESVKTKG